MAHFLFFLFIIIAVNLFFLFSKKEKYFKIGVVVLLAYLVIAIPFMFQVLKAIFSR